MKQFEDLGAKFMNLPKDENMVVMQRDQEYRICVGNQDQVLVILKQGQAEIFGAQMCQNTNYLFESGEKLAIYSWHGCSLHVNFLVQVEQKNKQSQCWKVQTDNNYYDYMIKYANIHYDLNIMRQSSYINKTTGPKVLICGSAYSGKTSVCQILINYAVKTGWNPLYVDLDVVKNKITAPGCFAAIVIQENLSNKNQFYEENNQLIMFHGFKNYSQKLLYQEQIKNFAKYINQKLSVNKDYQEDDFKTCNFILIEFQSGAIIKAPSYNNQLGFETYQKMIDNFQPDITIVIDNDMLYNLINNTYKNQMQVIQMQKSSGAQQPDEDQIKSFQDQKFNNYFIGENYEIMGSKHSIDISRIRIIQIQKHDIQKSALPSQGTSENQGLNLTFLNINDLKQQKIVGIIYLSHNEELEQNTDKFIEEVVKSPLAFMVYIEKVNFEYQSLDILFPNSQPPNEVFDLYWVYSEINWVKGTR